MTYVPHVGEIAAADDFVLRRGEFRDCRISLEIRDRRVMSENWRGIRWLQDDVGREDVREVVRFESAACT